jgi:hypothetical protein
MIPKALRRYFFTCKQVQILKIFAFSIQGFLSFKFQVMTVTVQHVTQRSSGLVVKNIAPEEDLE